MSKDLKFICCQPDDDYYLWQVHTWVESLKEIGHSDKAVNVIFTPSYRTFNNKWKDLEALYPEAEWFYVKDTDKIDKLIGMYIPIIRPYSLMKYFKAHPFIRNTAIFYCDCDIVFTKNFDITKYIDDDINYLSDTNSYINASYFDSKIRDVLPEKLEDYKQRDILGEIASMIGISREICEKNNDDSGGAQYLLKNIDSVFWEEVIKNTLTIRNYLQGVNRTFFKDENAGFQSWCADMWGVLWTLWAHNSVTKVVPEMEFAWSSDGIQKLEKVGILHNAGIVGNTQGDIPTFYKGNYHTGNSPFSDPYLQIVLNDERSKTLCNHYYLTKVFEVKNKYNLSY